MIRFCPVGLPPFSQTTSAFLHVLPHTDHVVVRSMRKIVLPHTNHGGGDGVIHTVHERITEDIIHIPRGVDFLACTSSSPFLRILPSAVAASAVASAVWCCRCSWCYCLLLPLRLWVVDCVAYMCVFRFLKNPWKVQKQLFESILFLLSFACVFLFLLFLLVIYLHQMSEVSSSLSPELYHTDKQVIRAIFQSIPLSDVVSVNVLTTTPMVVAGMRGRNDFLENIVHYFVKRLAFKKYLGIAVRHGVDGQYTGLELILPDGRVGDGILFSILARSPSASLERPGSVRGGSEGSESGSSVLSEASYE